MKTRSLLSTYPFKLGGRVATHPVRAFSAALYCSIFIVELVFFALEWCGSAYISSGALFMLMALLGLFVALDLAEQHFFPRKPFLILAIGSILLRVILTEVAGEYSCSGFHTFFALIPPMLAYLYIGPRAALVTAFVNIALYINWLIGDGPLTWDYIQEENVAIEFFIMVVGMLVMLILGRTLVHEERNRERAEQLFVELEQSQQQLTELAKVEERNRIARDIHDSVGHHLMVVNVQLEKATAFRTINPEEADQALQDAKRATQSALADVRQSVSTLRSSDDQFELSNALHELVDSFDRIQTNLIIEGDEAPFAKSTLIALYRAAQEGLTNIEKHAQATIIDLQVSLQPDHALFEMKDNGVGFEVTDLAGKADSAHAHFGLLGVRERIELQGGALTVESAPNEGTTLSIWVPTRRVE